MGEGSRRAMAEEDDVGPGAAHRLFETMSDLVDKLKLLNFEECFIKPKQIRPISRHYFALSTNTGEQFSSFTALCAWLINLTGRSFDEPQEYDDPNATISNILDEIRRFGINTDFPPSKLKTGSGEYVCMILNKLADKALESTQFSWSKPNYLEEDNKDDEETIYQEDEAELKLDKIEDEFATAIDSDDEADAFLDLAATTPAVDLEVAKKSEIMSSKTSYDEWKLEVERVTPSLKVIVRTDNKDWRTHVEQMQEHKHRIETSFVEAGSQLDKIQNDIQKTLEKIGSREKYINNQLESLVQEYRSVQERLSQAKEKYKEGSTGVSDRSRTLADLTEELEKIKMEMEEKGSSMTDGAPLVKIKQTLNRLKVESTQIDIRIGVIEHVLRQAHFRDKTLDLAQNLTNLEVNKSDNLGMY